MARKRDDGNEITEEILSKLENDIQKEYKQAYKEVRKKLKDFTESYEAERKQKLQQIKSGEITYKEYRDWCERKIFVSDRWKAMKESLAEDLANADKIARSMAVEHSPEVYSVNHSFAGYQVSRDAAINPSFTVYNRRAVEMLIRDKPDLLPVASKKMDIPKDKRWNEKKINSVVTQSILQGKPIDDVADSLVKVVGMDMSAAVRNARTMITNAQNRGRQDAFDELKEKGIPLREKWIATLDNRTRHSHRLMHGQYKNKDGYYPNGLRYPGDELGDPEEVYNCRCTEIAEIGEFAIDTPMHSPKMKDMTFDEWIEQGTGKADWHEAYNSDDWEIPDNKWKFEDQEDKQDLKEEDQEIQEETRTNVSDDTDEYKFGEMISDYTPVETREEAEQYAEQFVSSYKSKYSGNVSYKGIDVQYANTSNQILTEIYQRYNIDPLANITPMNKRESRFKNSTADAAYQWGGSGGNLFINGAFYKNQKALNAHIDEANSLLSTVLENADILLKGNISEKKRDYIEALVESGCQAVGQKVPKEEFARCTFIHETGHMLDDKLFGAIMKEKGFDVQESMKKYAKQISGYATSSRQEYIAESFASYWYGFDIDPELAKIFKEAEKK